MNNKISPVKNFWCNKVLPLVYDDSLSYYEVLCKLTNKVNELVENINNSFKSIFEENFNNIMIDAIYVEDTETIVLKKEVIAGEGIHVYDPNNNTMKIE